MEGVVPCVRGRYADMNGDKHKDKDTPEKCETIYRGEKREMPTHGSHEQKARYTATCILIVFMP